MIIQADAYDKFVLMLPEVVPKMTDCAVTVRCSSSECTVVVPDSAVTIIYAWIFPMSIPLDLGR